MEQHFLRYPVVLHVSASLLDRGWWRLVAAIVETKRTAPAMVMHLRRILSLLLDELSSLVLESTVACLWCFFFLRKKAIRSMLGQSLFCICNLSHVRSMVSNILKSFLKTRSHRVRRRFSRNGNKAAGTSCLAIDQSASESNGIAGLRLTIRSATRDAHEHPRRKWPIV